MTNTTSESFFPSSALSGSKMATIEGCCNKRQQNMAREPEFVTYSITQHQKKLGWGWMALCGFSSVPIELLQPFMLTEKASF